MRRRPVPRAFSRRPEPPFLRVAATTGFSRFHTRDYEFLNRETSACETKTHPLCGWRQRVIHKTPFHYNRVVQSLLQERKGVSWRINQMISLIQNGCVNTILYSHQSIGEKLFIKAGGKNTPILYSSRWRDEFPVFPATSLSL